MSDDNTLGEKIREVAMSLAVEIQKTCKALSVARSQVHDLTVERDKARAIAEQLRDYLMTGGSELFPWEIEE